MNYLVTYETMEDDISLIHEDVALVKADPAGDVLAQIREELEHACGPVVVVEYEQEEEDILLTTNYFC